MAILGKLIIPLQLENQKLLIIATFLGLNKTNFAAAMSYICKYILYKCILYAYYSTYYMSQIVIWRNIPRAG